MKTMKCFRKTFQRLQGISSSSLADAYRNLNPAWPTVGSLGSSINPVHKIDRNTRLIGTALTVECYANNYGGLVSAMQYLRQNTGSIEETVLCVRTHGTKSVAGSLMSADFSRQGMQGLVVDGNIRDASGIRAMKQIFPVYARGIQPSAGKGDMPGTVGEPICMGEENVVVETGDIIVGDDDGVVVIKLMSNSVAAPETESIASDRMERLLAEAERIEAREEAVLKEIEDGNALLDCL